jgi:hypothetical protein
MIAAIYNLAQLSDEVKAKNGIRSKARLDCVTYSDQMPGGYKALTNFVNSKGQLFFYLTPCRDFVNTDSRRMAEWSLTNSSQNLSSIYIEDNDFPEFGYGYPNANRLLSNRTPNPLFDYRNDGYLFQVNSTYTEIDLIVVKDGRNLITSYYHKMIDGGFADEVARLKAQARPFYPYDGL